EGTAASWRDVAAGRGALDGEMRVVLDSAAIAASEAPALASLQSFASFRSLKALGSVRVAAKKGSLEATAQSGPLVAIVSDAGGRLVVEAPAGKPFYVATGDRRRLDLTAALSGGADGRLALSAEQSGRAPWRYDVAADLGRQAFGDLLLRRAAFTAAGTASPAFDRLLADASVSAQVTSAVIGRFVAEDAPMAGRLRLDLDFKNKVVTVAAADATCLALARARLAVPAESTEARLVNARLCADGGPFVVSRWNGAPKTEVRGRLAASDAHYKVAATTLQGAPPDVTFVADYDPRAKTTRVTGTIRGGRIAVNDALLASAASGVFSGGLDATGLSGEARLDAVTFSHSAKVQQFAPVKARGSANFARQIFGFRFTAQTPDGRALGGGSGRHDVRSGRGEVAYQSGDLYFTPGGLQIARILPSFRGVIGGATGGVSADVKAFWGAKPGDFASSAEFRISNLSFRGPGVAVSSTEGLDGIVRLSSFFPVKTNGAEQITLRKLDIGALKLENGVLEFALPGDDTIRLIRAEFPWYGGKIGAYEATSPLTGSEASVKLRVDAVNLKELLAGLKIEGLSGEGAVEGVLPVAVINGRSYIRDGVMNAVGPGVIRYVGEATAAASTANAQAKLAFDLLRNLRFTKLGAKISGPLGGVLDFGLGLVG
ncbi:MAG: YdbH domain-containing protein, partial [Parvularculaceae bacterium]|nr:YdbH domain-containing protein [Parvularculaceae bacterium]